METENTEEWWAENAAKIAVLMKKTGVAELVIRLKPNGKYGFEITPKSPADPLNYEMPEPYNWHDQYDSIPNNRPQDGRVCDCEDAPCCGHYEI